MQQWVRHVIGFNDHPIHVAKQRVGQLVQVAHAFRGRRWIHADREQTDAFVLELRRVRLQLHELLVAPGSEEAAVEYHRRWRAPVVF